jgi:hypothetical protein
MPAAYKPFIGRRYAETRFLLVSESAYSWLDPDSGDLAHPEENHPTLEVADVVQVFDKMRDGYLRRVTMALTGKRDPSREEREAAWHDCAYTIYFPGTVGDAPRIRPNDQLHVRAKQQFLELLPTLNPRRVVVTGFETWGAMPDPSIYVARDFQAYRLPSGELSWVLAIGHPTGSSWEGWAIAHEQIQYFRQMILPER